jgi:hypothetical protein
MCPTTKLECERESDIFKDALKCQDYTRIRCNYESLVEKPKYLKITCSVEIFLHQFHTESNPGLRDERRWTNDYVTGT